MKRLGAFGFGLLLLAPERLAAQQSEPAVDYPAPESILGFGEYTLHKVWGTTALNPAIKTDNFQFPEGSVVMKAAVFLSDDPKIQSNCGR